MPSLLGTYVAANYGRMSSQDTYGGVTFSNFGTRNLAFIKVVSSGSPSPAVDFTAAAGTDTDASNISGYANPLTYNWQDSNSAFSVAVRTIQQFGEIYFVGTPVALSFTVAVAIDTMNSAAASSNVEVFNTSYPTLGTFGALAAQVATAATTRSPASSAAGVATPGTTPTITITQLTASGSSIA
jgi:hypothetical protein